MNAVPTATDTVETVRASASIPQHVIAAYHEAMTRDGRLAAMAIVEGCRYSFKDVAAAAKRSYGTQDEMR